jgi:hypothetical protein
VSVLNDILNNVTGIVTALGLSMNGQAVPVVLRKGAKKEPGVDPVPLITVSNESGSEEWHRFAFGNGPKISPTWKVIYKINITVIAANNDDFLTNLDVYAQWRQQLRNTFTSWPQATPQVPLPNVPQVFDLDVTPESFLDLGTMQVQYDDQRVSLLVTAAETSTN